MDVINSFVLIVEMMLTSLPSNSNMYAPGIVRMPLSLTDTLSAGRSSLAKTFVIAKSSDRNMIKQVIIGTKLWTRIDIYRLVGERSKAI